MVALTHFDPTDDERVAREIEGIDLVLGGHDHEPTITQDRGAPMVKAGRDAKWLAVVEMRVERPVAGRPARVRSVAFRLVPNIDVEPSPRIKPLVDAVEARLQTVLGEALATLPAPLDTRTAVVRTREAAMGNVLTDALRAHFSADAPLVNGGGMRGNREYPVGHMLIRRNQMAEMPFGNAVVLLEVNGAALLAALEYGVSGVEANAGRSPQVSGLRATYDPTARAGSRIHSIEIGGRPLEPERRYRLATVDYLSQGGDGYDDLKAAKVLVDASGGPLLVNVVAEAVGWGGPLSAVKEGRIRPVER